MVKSLEHPGSHLTHNQKTSFGMHPVQVEPEASRSMTLLRPVGQNPASHSLGAQNENSLFSSSMSELFSQKVRLSSNNALFGHSTETFPSYHEGDEPAQSLEEIEAQTIGDLLPKDDDLLSGMIDGHDYPTQPSNADDPEDLDIFGSIGGMDLGDDGSSNDKIRETPLRSDQNFIYDVRAAEAAIQALKWNDIAGEQMKLESTHPGSTRRLMQIPSEFDQDEFAQFIRHSSLNYDAATGFTGSLPRLASTPGSVNRNILDINSAARSPINPLLEGIPRGLQSHLGVNSFGKQVKLAENNQSQGHLFDIQGTSNFHARSLPGYNDDLAYSRSAGTIVGTINQRREIIDNRQQIRGVNIRGHADLSAGGNYNFDTADGSFPIRGHHVSWGNSYHPQPLLWPNSPTASLGNNINSHPSQILPSNMMNSALPVNNHHVGSAPTASPLWDRRQTTVGESLDASGVHRGSLGSMRMSNNLLHSVDFPPKSLGIQPYQQKSMMFPGGSQMLPTISPFDPFKGRDKSRRNESCSSQGDKKQFELDIDRIMQGEDTRTTLMIKNIPNKYTSKMLLTAIDERHKGTYDFIYLPIDFKNKCNVGYAFINMTDPKHIIPFYQTFNGKKWEKFNSEKVATLAYARIQGKTSLIAHFQNSSLMNEDKRCRPILFNTEGPNAGDQVPFPTGANIKSRHAKSRASTSEYRQESPSTVANEESLNSVMGDSSSASTKLSD